MPFGKVSFTSLTPCAWANASMSHRARGTKGSSVVTVPRTSVPPGLPAFSQSLFAHMIQVRIMLAMPEW